MRIALARWRAETDEQGFTAFTPDIDLDEIDGWGAIDLRGSGKDYQQSADGLCLVVAPNLDTAIPGALIDLGDDHQTRLGTTVGRALANRLGLNLVEATPGRIAAELLTLHARADDPSKPNPLVGERRFPRSKTDLRRRARVWCAGVLLYDELGAHVDEEMAYYAETFPTAGALVSSQDLPWEDLNPNAAVFVSTVAVGVRAAVSSSSSGVGVARTGVGVGSADMWASGSLWFFTNGLGGVGTVVRMSSSTGSAGYLGRISPSGGMRRITLHRMASDRALTSLAASPNLGTGGIPSQTLLELRTEANGSTIAAVYNSTAYGTTDTVITEGDRGGMCFDGGNSAQYRIYAFAMGQIGEGPGGGEDATAEPSAISTAVTFPPSTVDIASDATPTPAAISTAVTFPSPTPSSAAPAVIGRTARGEATSRPMVSAAFTPAEGDVVVAICIGFDTPASSEPDHEWTPTDTFGDTGGSSWESVSVVTTNDADFWQRTTVFYRTIGSGAAEGEITVDRSPGVFGFDAAWFHQLSGVDPDEPVRQWDSTALSNQSVTDIQVALPSAPAAGSLVITTVHALFGQADPGNPDGYTQVGSVLGDALIGEVAEAYAPDASQSATWTVNASASAGALIVEFQAAGAAPPEGVELAAAEVLPALGEAQAASVSVSAAAAETLPKLGESAALNVQTPQVSAALAETLPMLGDAASLVVKATATAAETLPKLGESAALAVSTAGTVDYVIGLHGEGGGDFDPGGFGSGCNYPVSTGGEVPFVTVRTQGPIPTGGGGYAWAAHPLGIPGDEVYDWSEIKQILDAAVPPDARRVALHGFSAGGAVAALALTQGWQPPYGELVGVVLDDPAYVGDANIDSLANNSGVKVALWATHNGSEWIIDWYYGRPLLAEYETAFGVTRQQNPYWSSHAPMTRSWDDQGPFAPPELLSEAWWAGAVTVGGAETLPKLGESAALATRATAAAAETLPTLTESLTGTVDRAVAAALAEVLPALGESAALELVMPARIAAAETLPTLGESVVARVGLWFSVDETLPALTEAATGGRFERPYFFSPPADASARMWVAAEEARRQGVGMAARRLMARYKAPPTGQTVVKRDGVYQLVPPGPTQQFLDECEEVYLGGRRYEIDKATAEALTAAGFGEFISR